MTEQLNILDAIERAKRAPTQAQVCRSRYDDGTYPDQFWQWLESNWHIVAAFTRLALQAKASGAKRWSADAILHVVRWETVLRDGAQNALKCNNNSTAGLARLCMELSPELKGFFKTRMPPGRAEARRLDGTLYSEGDDDALDS